MNYFECLAKGYVPPSNFFKSELLELLNISPDTWRKLYITAKRTVNNEDFKLINELKESGYKKRQRQFTKKQCRLIFEYVGYPDLTEKNKKILLLRGYISEKDIEQADFFAK